MKNSLKTNANILFCVAITEQDQIRNLLEPLGNFVMNV